MQGEPVFALVKPDGKIAKSTTVKGAYTKVGHAKAARTALLSYSREKDIKIVLYTPQKVLE